MATTEELIAAAKLEGALEALRDLDQKIMPSMVNKDQAYDTLQASLMKYELEQQHLQNVQRAHVFNAVNTAPDVCTVCGQDPQDPRHNVRPV